MSAFPEHMRGGVYGPEVRRHRNNPLARVAHDVTKNDLPEQHGVSMSTPELHVLSARLYAVGGKLVCLCGLALVASCGHLKAPPVPSSVGGSQAATDSLVRELRALTPSEHGRPRRANIGVFTYTSKIVPGLEYHWGDYEPPETAHIRYRAVVAGRGDQVAVLRTSADWAAVASTWSASSADEALAACREIVHVIRERHFPRLLPSVYTGPGSLTMVRDRDSLQQKLSLPVVQQRPARSWLVQFWAVGARDVTEFRCELAPESASLTTLQAFTGYVMNPTF